MVSYALPNSRPYCQNNRRDCAEGQQFIDGRPHIFDAKQLAKIFVTDAKKQYERRAVCFARRPE
jgi:hypothetical protein